MLICLSIPKTITAGSLPVWFAFSNSELTISQYCASSNQAFIRSSLNVPHYQAILVSRSALLVLLLDKLYLSVSVLDGSLNLA